MIVCFLGYGNGNSNRDKLEQMIESTEKRRIANGLTYTLWDQHSVEVSKNHIKKFVCLFVYLFFNI